jgi:glycogen synthase
VVRVLTITNWYPPHHFGGYELSCFDVMTRLESRGHEVHVLCGDTRLGPDRVPPDPGHEARVRRTLRLYHDGAQVLRPPWRERLAVERHNQAQLAAALREVRPDVVSVWHLAGASHGLLEPIARSGLPVVWSICDDWLSYGVRLDAWAGAFDRSRLRRLLGRVAGRLLGAPATLPDIGPLGSYLFVTRATEERALATSRWHPQRRAVVWSGIDGRLFTPADEPPATWSWRLVTTGRFDPRKGFETAIRALPLLPSEATLELWGRGGDAERARLAGIADELGVADRVRFGSLEREELPARYRAADVMVFPSVWAEPFGLVPVEAMACGTPVVATGVGGSAEFLADGDNCLLVPPGDPAALAAAVERLGGDPELRARLVAGGLRTAAVMDIERLADVMEAWHVWEAGGRKGSPPPDRRAQVARS